MNKINSNIKITGYALAIISFFEVMFCHPFNGYSTIPAIQFWSGLILYSADLAAGILVIKNVKKSTDFAMIAVAVTFLVNQIVSIVTVSDYSILDFILAAVVPGIFLFSFWNNREKNFISKPNRAQILN